MKPLCSTQERTIIVKPLWFYQLVQYYASDSLIYFPLLVHSFICMELSTLWISSGYFLSRATLKQNYSTTSEKIKGLQPILRPSSDSDTKLQSPSPVFLLTIPPVLKFITSLITLLNIIIAENSALQ